jgi:hypothetical protein
MKDKKNILVPSQNWNWSLFYLMSSPFKSVLTELFDYCLSGLFLVKALHCLE